MSESLRSLRSLFLLLIRHRLCAGWIDVAANWQWVMYFGAIVQAVSCIIIYFFMEETMYFRNMFEGVDNTSGATTPIVEPSLTEKTNDKTPNLTSGSVDVSASTTSPIQTYRQKLALFRSMPGRPSNKQMFKMMYRPLIMIYHFPSVTWAGLYVTTPPKYPTSHPLISNTPQRLRHMPIMVQRPQRHHILHPQRLPLQLLLGPSWHRLYLAVHRRRARSSLERLVNRQTGSPARAEK